MAEGEGTPSAPESNEKPPPQGDGQGEPDKGTPGNGAPDDAELKRLTSALADERKRREATQRELDEAKKAAMTAQERAVAEAKAEGRKEAVAELAGKMLEAEVRAQAAGKLADPADAARLLDLEGFLDDDGTYDPKAIGRALDELVKAKPYLAPAPTNGARPPQGARDGGGGKGEADDFIRGLVKR